jgi:hypothetical protein
MCLFLNKNIKVLASFRQKKTFCPDKGKLPKCFCKILFNVEKLSVLKKIRNKKNIAHYYHYYLI